MKTETFTEQIQRIVDQSQKESPEKDFLAPYYHKYKSVSDEIFTNMVDWIIDNVNLKFQFPTLFDFAQAKNDVAPVVRKAPSTLAENWKENSDPKSKADTREWAREQAKRFRNKPKDKRELPTLAEKIASYENHIKRGECYSVDRGKWVPESDIGNDRVVWAIDKLKELKQNII